MPKLEAFGWYVQRVDGNDIDAVTRAFDHARNHDKPQPRIIVCDTKMDCGVPFFIVFAPRAAPDGACPTLPPSFNLHLSLPSHSSP